MQTKRDNEEFELTPEEKAVEAEILQEMENSGYSDARSGKNDHTNLQPFTACCTTAASSSPPPPPSISTSTSN